ncbi:MAG: PAS domain S-box protein [Syntrophobacteraceae bacterium]
MICPIFQQKAEGDPRGWNHFLADEMGYLTRIGDKTTACREEMYIEVFNHLPHGLLIADEQDRVHYVNEAAERITGLPANVLIGGTSEDIFSSSHNEVESALREDMQGRADVCISELSMSPCDDETVFVKRTTSSIRDAHGSVIAKMHVMEDMSDRRRLECDLKRSKNKYRHLFDDSKDMIFIHSKGGIFKDVNQACVETLGYGSKEELLSVASVERIYVNPMHRRVFQEQIDRFGFVKDFEISFQKRDGTRLHCLVSGNAVRDTDGKITGYEAISKDITARMDGVRNLHQQNRELSLLHSIAVAMNVTQDLDEILMMALRKVLEVLNLSSGAIFLINKEKSAFTLKVQQGLPEKVVGNGCGLELYDQALMQSLLEEDRSLKPQRTFPPFKASLKAADDDDSVQLLCFLITAKKSASGFIALELAQDKNISDRDHQMLGSLGNFLGSAVDNACLARTIRQHREELRGLTARLFHSQEEERKRIARELHDETGQALTGISFALDTILKTHSPEMAHIEEEILDIKKQINRTYQEIRRISHRLHPALLSDLGLEPALESCLGRISKYSQIAIDFKMVGFEERMGPQIETILYRISQEVVNNTVKHSQAKHFRLSIIKSYPNIIFLAEDDGVGFDPDQFEGHRQALGLLGMRERASLAGGKFSLRTGKGKGTRIRIEIPIRESWDE